jgi:hypothetical protein
MFSLDLEARHSHHVNVCIWKFKLALVSSLTRVREELGIVSSQPPGLKKMYHLIRDMSRFLCRYWEERNCLSRSFVVDSTLVVATNV